MGQGLDSSHLLSSWPPAFHPYLAFRHCEHPRLRSRRSALTPRPAFKDSDGRLLAGPHGTSRTFSPPARASAETIATLSQSTYRSPLRSYPSRSVVQQPPRVLRVRCADTSLLASRRHVRPSHGYCDGDDSIGSLWPWRRFPAIRRPILRPWSPRSRRRSHSRPALARRVPGRQSRSSGSHHSRPSRAAPFQDRSRPLRGMAVAFGALPARGRAAPVAATSLLLDLSASRRDGLGRWSSSAHQAVRRGWLSTRRPCQAGR